LASHGKPPGTLKDHNVLVHRVYIDPRFLETLRHPNIEVLRHNIVADPLPEASFDLVHTRLVLLHIPQREQALERMIAALKPDGWLVVEEYDSASMPPDPAVSPGEVLLTIGPKNMPHFGWSKVESTIHVYGTGPFRSTLIDPVYELTREGTLLLTSLLQPGTPTNSSPPDCFALKLGVRVKSAEAEGTVVGARCSPANHITQYWIEKSDGRRFWATLQELGGPIH